MSHPVKKTISGLNALGADGQKVYGMLTRAGANRYRGKVFNSRRKLMWQSESGTREEVLIAFSAWASTITVADMRRRDEEEAGALGGGDDYTEA